MNYFEVTEALIPATLDGAGGAEFREMVAVRNEIEAEVMGTEDVSPTAEDLLPNWQNPYEPQSLFLARVDGRIVGRGVLGTSLDSATVAYVSVEVLSEYRRRGIGAALFDALEAKATSEGRSVLQGDATSVASSGEMLAAPTGFGAVPADSPATRFALARGFTLEQVYRASRLVLPVDVSTQLEAAITRSGPDFAIVTWDGATHDRWLSDVARLHARMSTDAPSAGLAIDEESWDADRVRKLDELRARSGSLTLIAAAQHLPTGRLVAFTELSVPAPLTLAVHQQDTLVLREHRGHGLGMLVKLANLEALAYGSPGHPSVITFNAEENRHMLAVNEAIGFVAFAYEGAWQRGVRTPTGPSTPDQ